MSLWSTYPLLLPSLIVGVTIVLWATSLLPEFITALLFFTAAMTAKIAPPEVIFGGFASSAFWLVFSGFVLGVAIRKTGLADRAARALSARLTDSWVLMVAGVVLLGYALACVMPSQMGRMALLMPDVAIYRLMNQGMVSARRLAERFHVPEDVLHERLQTLDRKCGYL